MFGSKFVLLLNKFGKVLLESLILRLKLVFHLPFGLALLSHDLSVVSDKPLRLHNTVPFVQGLSLSLLMTLVKNDLHFPEFGLKNSFDLE